MHQTPNIFLLNPKTALCEVSEGLGNEILVLDHPNHNSLTQETAHINPRIAADPTLLTLTVAVTGLVGSLQTMSHARKIT